MLIFVDKIDVSLPGLIILLPLIPDEAQFFGATLLVGSRRFGYGMFYELSLLNLYAACSLVTKLEL